MPRTRILPLVMRCVPTIARMSVVLPQPEGPSRPVIDPSGHRAAEAVEDLNFSAAYHEVIDLDRRFNK